jgi:glucan phosphorylase
MTVLAMRMAASSNGVSKLHGEVSRRMWQGIWPGVPVEEVPIGHVTNGVHFRSWISNEMNQLYDRYLGPQWRDAANGDLWKRVETIPAEELWRTHERRRERLVAFARRKLRDQLKRRGAPQSEIEAADEVLDARGADHRLCAAVRHLQAGHPAAARYRAPEAHPIAMPSGPCRSSMPARRIRAMGAARS